MSNICLDKNRDLLARSKKVLASASTFSKVELFGNGETPFGLVKGQGAYVWDVDNNKYIDYVMGLGCVTLGYNHPKANQAISEQLNNGIAFSLPTELEVEVAEMLIERIPSAEMVRFGKNGNDVTAAAVRIARHVTKKDHILFCGYHGWQDWYISQSSKNGGIPNCVKELSHRFTYNDIGSLTRLVQQYKDNVACIILEPISKEWPVNDFLGKVRDIATKNNIVLIFDEVVTGFRFHKAGVQALMNVTPDLSCFSKAIANGMPLSVLVGKAEIMSKFNEIFFSLTNAGETLSLAAAKAVIQFYDEVDVPARLSSSGGKLKNGLQELISKYDLGDRIKVTGFDCRFWLAFADPGNPKYDPTNDILCLARLLASHGILSNGGFMVSYSHNENIIQDTLSIFERVLPALRNDFLGKVGKVNVNLV